MSKGRTIRVGKPVGGDVSELVFQLRRLLSHWKSRGRVLLLRSAAILTQDRGGCLPMGGGWECLRVELHSVYRTYLRDASLFRVRPTDESNFRRMAHDLARKGLLEEIADPPVGRRGNPSKRFVKLRLPPEMILQELEAAGFVPVTGDLRPKPDEGIVDYYERLLSLNVAPVYLRKYASVMDYLQKSWEMSTEEMLRLPTWRDSEEITAMVAGEGYTISTARAVARAIEVLSWVGGVTE